MPKLLVLKAIAVVFTVSAFLICSCVFGQTVTTDSAQGPPEWNIRPKIGVGVGMMNYQGDLITNRGYFNLFQNKTAVHVNAAQPINDFLELNFFMLYGSLGADERTLERNLNFSSRITSGGISLSYNFNQLLKPKRLFEPFISVGFEAFDFQTKTDLFDQYGNPYYYWSDGTIRNLSETDENLGNAIEITRDYVYDTDVRELNADGFGDYNQRSFAVPFGGGFSLNVSPKVALKGGVEYHYSFTDLIDGITSESRGVRKGNANRDHWLQTFVRLSYDLTPTPHLQIADGKGADGADTDLDSIADFLDKCPATPPGIAVDEQGCPLDSDGDSVPDYLDDELNSPAGSVVDSAGVALNDAQLEQMYLEFYDETGKYAQYTNQSYSLETVERKTQRRKASYTVKIGESEEAISDSLANVLLSNPDIQIKEGADGKTVIEVAGLESLPEAVKTKIDLESQGIATSEVTETTAGGKTTSVTKIEQDAVSKKSSGLSVEQAIAKNKSLPAPKKLILDREGYTIDRPIDSRSVSKVNDTQYGDNTVYRVQVGAFANKLRLDVFADVKDLVVVTTSDGLTRYYVGAFTSYEQAASRKIDMIERGFNGAYVVPFKNGERTSLPGAPQSQNSAPAANNAPAESGAGNFGKVKFKVQIGSYVGDIPTDVLDKMMDLGRIDQRPSDDGSVKYLTGEFNTAEEAQAMRDDLVSQGFSEAATVAEFEGKLLSTEEGLNLLNQ